MRRQRSARQRIRQGLLLLSLLLFPIILNYFSPVIIIEAAAMGVINGSLITFGLMFLSALFVGRLWCGWACPGGGLQEACFAINDRPARGGRLNWIKWLIWVPWIGGIVAAVVAAGGYQRVEPFLFTENGISVINLPMYIIYYVVVGLFVVLALVGGRRGACHYACWMAPFMIIGRRIRNLFGWPALRLKADAEACVDCGRCAQVCPMSLDVPAMVQRGEMENAECILCGSCVDTCPKDAIFYSFSAAEGGLVRKPAWGEGQSEAQQA